MKVFIAGATGVLGRSAVRAFVTAGHDVRGVARSDEKAALLRSLGGSVAAAPSDEDVVCNFATHIPPMTTMALRRSWRENDMLHRDGSRQLVDAAIAAGAKIFMQHSSGFMYADGGANWLDEDAPRDAPPHGASIIEAEAQTARFAENGGTGIALRFGFFYGPDASTTRDQLRMARMGICPTPGTPDAYYPSIHTDDLGTAAAAALRAPSGNYNVTDDEPLTRAETAQVVASAIGRKKLRVMRMPLKRFDYIARSQRVSNKRFKEATGWEPRWPSSREGWPETIKTRAAAR